MIKKFNKYWDLIKEYAILLNTLDPKYKLDTLEADEQIRVKSRLAAIYDDYKKKYPNLTFDPKDNKTISDYMCEFTQ